MGGQKNSKTVGHHLFMLPYKNEWTIITDVEKYFKKNPLTKWYFVTKIVLTYSKILQILGLQPRISKVFLNP
jgi:hypothetical protein